MNKRRILALALSLTMVFSTVMSVSANESETEGGAILVQEEKGIDINSQNGIVITAFAPMPAFAENAMTINDKLTVAELAKELGATVPAYIQGSDYVQQIPVNWICPDYELGNANGTYVFTAAIDTSVYQLAEGVTAPTITVSCLQDMQAVQGQENPYGAMELENFYFEPLSESAEYGSIDNAGAPSYYNPVQNGFDGLPVVRNQNPYGCCWAFATVGVAEAAAYKGGDKGIDLSENHLAFFSYNSVVDPLGGTAGDVNALGTSANEGYLNAGGNVVLASNVIMTGQGLAAESTAPFPTLGGSTNLDRSIAYKDQLHATNTYILSTTQDTDAIKDCVMKYGGAAIMYYDSNAYYNASTNAYNCTYGGGVNHAVEIVGWDDNFSAYNFRTPALRDGAWLIRNSWGRTEYSHYGYFWMSYYDASLARSNAVTVTYAPANNYDNIYQYDGAMNTSYLANVKKISNIFTIKGGAATETVNAVAFSLANSGVNYTAKIYKDVTGGNPESGTLVASASGRTYAAGFTHVDLPTPVVLPKGTNYSVVVEFASGVYPYCESSVYTWFKTVASIKPGQSYAQGTSGGWIDISKFASEGYGNLQVKAYTKNGGNNPNPGPSDLPFNDVPSNAWYYNAVKFVYQNGIMNGTGSGFNPNGQCTREMMVTLLYNAAGKPNTAFNGKFIDVPNGKWYSTAVSWAVNKGVTNGQSANKFGVGVPVTRAQVAGFLYNFAKSEGKSVSAQADLSKYPDNGQIPSWARTSLAWANAKGIINGTGAGTLNPNGTATRAEIATMIMNYKKNV